MDLQHKYHGPVERLWPRRLLDTSTMTSFERQEGNIYGSVREPKYSAISYSWGRFSIPGENNSPDFINNLTWRLPCINPSYFKSEDLSRMLSQTTAITGDRFVWLDVACIDQSDLAVKMDETAKMPGIFANASVVFAWLCTVSTHELRKTWDCWKKLLRPQHSDGSLFKDRESLSALEHALHTLLDDPWFSSLWALQVEGLREDTLLLSLEGEVPEADTIPCNVHSIHLGLSIISSTLSSISGESRSLNAGTGDTVNDIKLLVDNSAVPAPGSNPNLSYIASYKRKVACETDRIYAMMGLYDIKVGAGRDGADRERDYTLSELQEEFAIALNRKSFFLGQLFVHVGTPAPGKSWQITPTARVPKGFEEWTHRHVTADCVFEALPSASAHVSANITPFENLVNFWKIRVKDLPDIERNDQLVVVVDDYIRQTQPATPTNASGDSPSGSPTSTFLHTQETVDWLASNYGVSRLSVLFLGGLSFRVDLYDECFGLLIMHDEKDRSRCQRVGLCKWEGNDYFGHMGISEEAKASTPKFGHRYDGVMS